MTLRPASGEACTAAYWTEDVGERQGNGQVGDLVFGGAVSCSWAQHLGK